MAFSENLVYLRKKASLSQEQLVQSLNVTRQAISKWESGQSTPDVETLLQLSDIFGVATDQLLKNPHSVKYETKKSHDFYTVLAFVGLAILWFTGLILVIINLFFNQSGVFQVHIWHISLAMMLCSLLAFVCMLIAHRIRLKDSNKV